MREQRPAVELLKALAAVVFGSALLVAWFLRAFPVEVENMAFGALMVFGLGYLLGHRSGRKEAIAKLQAELASMKGEEPLRGEVLSPERAEAFRDVGARLVEEALGLPPEPPRLR